MHVKTAYFLNISTLTLQPPTRRGLLCHTVDFPSWASWTTLEPHKMPLNKAKTEAIISVRARWLGVLDEVRTLLLSGKSTFGYSFSLS